MFDSYGDFLLPGLRSKRRFDVLLLQRTNQMEYFAWRFATCQMLICTAHACMPRLACSWQHASFRAGSKPERNKFHGWIYSILKTRSTCIWWCTALYCTAQGGGCLHCWAWRMHDMELGSVMSSSVWESKTKCHRHQVIDKRDYTSTCASIDGVLCLLSLDTLKRWCSHHPFAHGKQPTASTKQSLHSLLTTKMVGLEVLERKQSSKAGSTNTPAAKLAAKAF